MIGINNESHSKKNFIRKFPLYLLIASIPIEMLLSGTFFTIPKILGILVIFLFLINLKAKNFIIKIDLTSIVFFIFVLYSYFSIFWSNIPEESKQSSFSVLQIFIIYIVIINEITNFRSMDNVMKISLWGGVILGFSGLLEIFQNENLLRLSGLTQNANLYFIMAIFTIPSLYWSIKQSKSILIKSLIFLTTVLLFFTSLLTESIGGVISLLVFLLSYSILSRKKQKAFLITIIVLLAIIIFAPNSFWNRFTILGDSSTDRFSVLWPAGFDLFKNKLLFGHGIGTSDFLLPSMIFTKHYEHISVHNSLLAVGIDLGILGTLLYLLTIIIPTIKLYRLIFDTKNKKFSYLENFGLIIICVLLAYLASWIKSGGFEYFKYLWIIIGFETCMYKIILIDRRNEFKTSLQTQTKLIY